MPFKREDREAQFVAVAFAELAVADRFEQERQVCEAGHRVCPTESLVEKDMKGCAWQPFLATNDVRHLHQVVVHDVGEMVSWQLVGTLVEHLIVEDTAVDTHFSANDVVHNHVPSRLNQEANHILLAFRNQLLDLFFGESQRVAHLHSGACIVLEILYLSAFGIEFLGCIKGDVGLAVVEKLVNILLVDVPALALAIRPLIASEAHTLVKFDAQPFERLNDVFFRSRHKTP